MRSSDSCGSKRCRQNAHSSAGLAQMFAAFPEELPAPRWLLPDADRFLALAISTRWPSLIALDSPLATDQTPCDTAAISHGVLFSDSRRLPGRRSLGTAPVRTRFLTACPVSLAPSGIVSVQNLACESPRRSVGP